MKIHFLLLALVAVVALSQRNVDARLHDGFDDLRRLGSARCRFDKDCGWSMVQYCDIDGFCKDVCTPGGCRCDGGRCNRRRMTEHRLLDELLQRRMEELEEMEGEQDSFPDGFDESRRLGSCTTARDCPLCGVRGCWRVCRSGNCGFDGSHK